MSTPEDEQMFAETRDMILNAGDKLRVELRSMVALRDVNFSLDMIRPVALPDIGAYEYVASISPEEAELA